MGVRGGLDCVGLPLCAARALGYPVVDMVYYSETPDPQQLVRYVNENCEQVQHEEPGDLILFWIRCENAPTHAGIYTDAHTIIHARRSLTDPSGGRVTEEPMVAFWKKRIHSVWRYRWL